MLTVTGIWPVPMYVSPITSKAQLAQANSIWMPASPGSAGIRGLSRSPSRDQRWLGIGGRAGRIDVGMEDDDGGHAVYVGRADTTKTFGPVIAFRLCGLR